MMQLWSRYAVVVWFRVMWVQEISGVVWWLSQDCVGVGDDKTVHEVVRLCDMGARSACLWLVEKKLSLQGKTLAYDAAMEQVGCGVMGWGVMGWGGVWHRSEDRTYGDSETDGLRSAFGCLSMALVVFGVGGGLKMQCAPACTFMLPAV
jgi:hypothetical protein